MFGFLEEHIIRPVCIYFGLYTEASLPQDSIEQHISSLQENINRYQASIASGLSVNEACFNNPICSGFDEIDGGYDSEAIALLGIAVSTGLVLLAAGGAAAYWYTKDDEHCKLTGKDSGKEQATKDFFQTFQNILDKYKNIDVELPENEKGHLEEALKSLFKYYFWKNPTLATDNDMRNGLYQKLSIAYHPDRGCHSTLLRFNSLMGITEKGTIFKIMGEVKDKKPNKSDNPDNYINDKNYLRAIPNLSTALAAHQARDIRALVANKM